MKVPRRKALHPNELATQIEHLGKTAKALHAAYVDAWLAQYANLNGNGGYEVRVNRGDHVADPTFETVVDGRNVALRQAVKAASSAIRQAEADLFAALRGIRRAWNVGDDTPDFSAPNKPFFLTPEERAALIEENRRK